jgi:biotin operon repressor
MAKKRKNGHTAKSTNGTRRSPYPYDAFVKNWTKAESVKEVATMTGLSKSNIAATVNKLRKAGVKLKEMPKSYARLIDVTSLNKLIKESTTKPAPKAQS